jgi:hypothetical protein
MPIRIAKVKSSTLKLPLTGDATSIQLKEFVTHKDEQLDIDDFGGLVVLILKQGDQVELAICDSLSYDDDGVATLEFANNGRNLDGQYPYAGTNVGLDFSVGAEVVVGDDPYTVYQITEAYTNSVAFAGAPNASAVVQGLVEIATEAEIDADTETGATGAILAISPDKLATSKYGERLPTADEKAALATTPAASGANPYATKYVTINAGETINGATLPVPVYQNTSDSEVYACDGNDTAKLKFIGFAKSNSTNGNPIAVQEGGIVDGFTGLTVGPYYLSDTVGTIQTTPGTNEVLVGWAISATQLLILRGKRRASGNGGSLGTASGSLVVTTGFRPSVIRIRASASATTYLSLYEGVYANGVLTGLASHYNEGSSSASRNENNLYSQDTSNIMAFTITDVTATGFTIVWTETGTFNPTESAFSWEAEGEL